MFPPDKHQELISAVYDAAAEAGEPMSKADQRKLAINTRWNDDTIIINNDRTKTEAIANQNSPARHLAKLKAADESLFRQVQAGLHSSLHRNLKIMINRTFETIKVIN